jgi:photosystem II stability/assembly factor-like uncharacterized protein
MTCLVIATRAALLIVRQGKEWSVEEHLGGKIPVSIAIDPADPGRLYAGSEGQGLWRSTDAGRSWQPAGPGIPHAEITAMAVAHTPASHPGTVFAGTEPSTLSRSEDGGATWRELGALLELPSSSHWSFPPKPYTHHVRWIEIDPHAEGRLYVAIEAGALVRSNDGGETWRDHVPGGPIDTHTAATHPVAEGRLYSAAGDGYFESLDGGETWSRPMDGLRHGYLVSVAVDSEDPDKVVVSAARGPYVAYRPGSAEAYVYRKTAGRPFEPAMDGLPDAQSTVASRLVASPGEAGVFYAANNHGLFRSQDGGRRWQPLEIRWPEGVFRHGVEALAAFAE